MIGSFITSFQLPDISPLKASMGSNQQLRGPNFTQFGPPTLGLAKQDLWGLGAES